jgi:WD repeat-containing protein 35
LNQWNTAVELAEIHKFKEIKLVISKYSEYLLGQGKKWDAIQLYRKANYCQQSAKLLFQVESLKNSLQKNTRK